MQGSILEIKFMVLESITLQMGTVMKDHGTKGVSKDTGIIHFETV